VSSCISWIRIYCCIFWIRIYFCIQDIQQVEQVELILQLDMEPLLDLDVEQVE
jgi:hypothetical protein